MNRIISLILSFVLIVSLFNGMPLNAFAAGETITATVQGEYQPSSAEQDVTIRINVNNLESPYCGFYIGSTTLPDGFAIKSFSTSYTTQPIESRDYNLSTGKLTYEEANTEDNIPGDTYYEVVITVPANADGDYTIAFNDVEVGYDQGFEVYVRADEVNATLTISEPAAPPADYEIYYELDKTDGTDGDNYHEYGIGNQVTATVYMKNNTGADVVIQAYDIYLTYSNKLSYASETMAGAALTANSNTAAVAGAAVSHIQLVKDTTTIALNDGQEVSLGTIVFNIVDSAVYGEALPITLTIGTSGKTVTNFAISNDQTSYYPVNTGTVLGAEVNTTYTVSYVDGVDDETIDVPDAQTKYYNENLTLSSTVPTREGYSFTGWSGSDNKSYQAGNTYATNANLTLTAQWQKNAVTIKWMNGTTQLGNDVEVEYGTVPSYSGATPTKAADAQYTYTHAGWTTDPDGTTPETLTAVTEDTTYYAVFSTTTNKYTVTWNNYDGTELEKDENVPYGTTPTYDSATPTRPATTEKVYTFDTWSPAVDAVTGDVTYTATFTEEARPYTVKFATQANGTLADAGDQTVVYGDKPTYPTVTANAGYEFDGWYNKAGNKIDTANYTVAGDETLTAQYKATEYIITLDVNGGDTLDTSTWTYKITDTVTLPTATKTGAAFDGWKLETATGSWKAKTYSAGDYDNQYGTISLVAQWSNNAYTITQGSVTGGAVTPSKNSANYGEEITLSNTPADGYVFDSYTVTDASGNPIVVTDGKFTMPDSNVTVSATFNPIDYTVTIGTISNGSVTASKTAQVHVGDEITLTSTANTGYKWASYTVTYKDADNNDQTVTVTDGKFTMPAANVTVTATFEGVGYTIAYNNNGGTGTMTATSAVYGTDVALSENLFSKTGYEFKGWATTDTGAKVHDDKATVNNLTSTEDGIVTLYAVWEAKQYDVTLDYEYEGKEDGSIKVTYDSAYYPALTDPSREGYTFDGWYTTNDASGTKIESGTTVTTADKHTLYARWSANKYTVTLNHNYQGSTDGSIEVEYDSTYAGLTNPTRPGYTFDGWYDAEEDGNIVNSTDKVTITEDTTLYAYWSVNNYTITFTMENGDVIGSVEYTTEHTATLGTAQNGLYTFAGWKLDTATDGWQAGTYTADTPVTGKWGNVTLVAQWNFTLSHKVENYKYAYDTEAVTGGYKLLIVTNDLADGKEYKFNGASMYYTTDSNYLVNTTDSSVFYTLIPEEYVGADSKLNADGIAKLTTGDADATNGRATIDYTNRDINNDGVVNIADANVVYQMVINGGSYYSDGEKENGQLTIEQRLRADMDKTATTGSNEYRGSIADVDVIVNEINGVTN